MQGIALTTTPTLETQRHTRQWMQRDFWEHCVLSPCQCIHEAQGRAWIYQRPSRVAYLYLLSSTREVTTNVDAGKPAGMKEDSREHNLPPLKRGGGQDGEREIFWQLGASARTPYAGQSSRLKNILTKMIRAGDLFLAPVPSCPCKQRCQQKEKRD